MKSKHNPAVVPSMTVRPGDVIAITDTQTKTIARIEQTAFDKYQLTFNENDASAAATENVIDVDTRGYDRIAEPEPDLSTGTPTRRLVENVASLDLRINDVLSLPVFGKAQITEIVCIRPDRYQITLQVKFVAAFVIDVVVKS
ncbi:hypothetical protein [Cryobacterium zhongshanensis]|uniref:Uncharacterized protein n=1 Tax=Cryobacterium zhongshanensis TaxID=2928153 RepID=A0AA41R2N0_9MICO|nr:hypothetical protein [Cryobacterium zhongshanensis]MCI4659716.1 hypothetical protein [Cryobacterium zhongshanensis]